MKDTVLTTIQVTQGLRKQIKLQAAENDMNMKEYIQSLADSFKDDTIFKMDNAVLEQLKEQSNLTSLDESEYLRIVLDFYKSEASHRRD